MTMEIKEISPGQLSYLRLLASGLIEPFKTPLAAAQNLCGVQAQILNAAALALFNRTPLRREADFASLLYTSRSLVKIWGQRGTLHLYATKDWPLLAGAFSNHRSWWERQAKDPKAYLEGRAAVMKILKTKGIAGRSDIRHLFGEDADSLLSSWGGVFQDIVYHGLACHAKPQGAQGLFAWREQWLPEMEWAPPPPKEANTEILRRYLKGYGPAGEEDFIYWRGTRKALARELFEKLEKEIIEVFCEGKKLFMHASRAKLLAQPVPPTKEWPVKMLYRFDPVILGYKNKDWLIAPKFKNRVIRSAGHIEGILLAGGKARATWRYARENGGLVFTVKPFEKLPSDIKNRLDEKSSAIASYFGLPKKGLRFQN